MTEEGDEELDLEDLAVETAKEVAKKLYGKKLSCTQVMFVLSYMTMVHSLWFDATHEITNDTHTADNVMGPNEPEEEEEKPAWD